MGLEKIGLLSSKIGLLYDTQQFYLCVYTQNN